ncbi:Helicase Domain-Containing Protein [Thioalkalivibrio nitratireducens DSM 14787]|uniref:Helicase Domain-Containing Protein n=1 Tax=Thioalkalivibrio nitratireducens (strain DSM 14787 / UNIQEM 213 / ALEN2) TaxID=1255043 RepID=L0E0R4_THIND|nr:helicase-related protein [Thioalkalivibrio nitratireducens]AGA34810.1 Helicase Domain-Containing Protein [Thioalkalivibrio nitratireducens DSM 14787]
MQRPDVDSALGTLKPFQRRTVAHAFRRLFEAPDSTGRFLVADEVGLGKTLVARGIIAKAIDRLWYAVDHINVVYICSNTSIARANLPKLQIGSVSQNGYAQATRLTMLATELALRDNHTSLRDGKVNFISFTPGTSFEMGHSGGHARERRVLYHLLEPLDLDRTGLMHLLQGAVRRTEIWQYKIRHRPLAIDAGIAERFVSAVNDAPGLREDLRQVIETWFTDHRDAYPRKARQRCNQLLSRLRRLLAEVCVRELEPDLIILDEFQRFKALLETRDLDHDPAAELAQHLFNAPTREGHPVRTLLLSATPYKLYTADAEIQHEDHYADFLATTRFLMAGDESKVQQLQARLSRFGTELKRASLEHTDRMLDAKRDVEDSLCAVMSRTERVAASADRDAMVAEPPARPELTPLDVRHFIATDAVFRAVGDHDPMPFWKSAPYPLHFMHGYRVNERLTDALSLSPDKVSTVLRTHRSAFLAKQAFEDWSEIDPGNAKLRELVSSLLDRGLWKLLWIPPTVPYWDLEGPYADKEGLTKSLLFSAWNVVPDAVSAMLSYEAERRMVGGSMDSYLDPDRQQRGLLRLTQTGEGTRNRHRLLLLLLPCLPLADVAHPLGAPFGEERRAWVRARVETLLAQPDLPDPQEGPVDDRWEWMILRLLDPGMDLFLARWRDANEDDVAKPNPEVMSAYLDDLLQLDAAELGRRPEHLAELVTELALGAPGVLAVRSLAPAGLDDLERRFQSVEIAHAFWKLFNRPAVVRLLQQVSGHDPHHEEADNVYWKQVLRYCVQGNLQAVLDEMWHLRWEQHAWNETASTTDTSRLCVADIAEAVEPRPSRVHAQFYQPNGTDNSVTTDQIRIRTVLCLRFGHIRSEDGAFSQDAVRSSFNSPFRPFVLASTSVGQEGLDFHPWCHHLVHWDLPGNPVDLEQREGRVHRYKGHAVRKNVAEQYANEALRQWQPGDDLWHRIFNLAEQQARSMNESDLVPYWIVSGKHRVQRYVPLLPYSKEVEAFGRLKKQLAAYRVVFGQPRQEELLGLLEQADMDAYALQRWAIDLSPPT